MGSEGRRGETGTVSAPTADEKRHSVATCTVCGRRNRVPVVAAGRPRCAECHADLPWLVDADESSFDGAVAGPGLVMVDFWAPWCGPCRSIAPILERLAQRYVGQLKIVKLMVDGAPAIASRYRAQSIPLLVVLHDGIEVERVIGAHPERHLDDLVQRNLRTH